MTKQTFMIMISYICMQFNFLALRLCRIRMKVLFNYSSVYIERMNCKLKNNERIQSRKRTLKRVAEDGCNVYVEGAAVEDEITAAEVLVGMEVTIGEKVIVEVTLGVAAGIVLESFDCVV